VTGPPKWPEIELVRHAPDHVTVETDTGRPKTPIFALHFKGDAVPFWTDAELLEHGRQKMQEAYENAHPEGCPTRDR
jgi:hypothetical protein